VTDEERVNPASSYPALPSPVPVSGACTGQTGFSIAASGAPATINKNETLYKVEFFCSGLRWNAREAALSRPARSWCSFALFTIVYPTSDYNKKLSGMVRRL
jgi:hypothetical protein